jgi:hypothetical protein
MEICSPFFLPAPSFCHKRADEKERMLGIQMPPDITPTRFDLHTCSFVAEPIPGMVRLPLGIPLVHHVDGNPKHAITVACTHSLSTLMEYDEGSEIQNLIPRLLELTWAEINQVTCLRFQRYSSLRA